MACAASLLSCHYDFTRYSCNQNLKPISREIAGATHSKKTSSKMHFAPLWYVVVAQHTSTKTSCTLVYQCSSSSIGRREQVWKLPHLPSRNSNGWKSFLHKKVFAALLTPVIYVHTNIHIVRMLLCTDPLPVCSSSSCWLDGRRRRRQAVRLLGPAGEAEGGGTWFQSDRISMSCASITRD